MPFSCRSVRLAYSLVLDAAGNGPGGTPNFLYAGGDDNLKRPFPICQAVFSLEVVRPTRYHLGVTLEGENRS